MKNKWGLIIAGLVSLVSCVTNPTINYKTINSVNNSEFFSDEILSKKELARRGLEKVLISEIFNPKFISQFENVNFTYKEDNPNEGGFFNPDTKEINVSFSNEYDKNFREKYKFAQSKEDLEEDLNFYNENNAFDTIVHELLHFYYNSFMSEQERNEFRRIILKIAGDSVKENKIEKSYRELENISEFLKKGEYYKKEYEKEFDRLYWGTEAFAQLGDRELTNSGFNYWITKNREPEEVNGSIIRDYFYENCEKNSKKLKGLPQELLKFYRGCINERYFENVSKD